jgi:O-antigen/teichoic acid export membrane protein
LSEIELRASIQLAVILIGVNFWLGLISPLVSALQKNSITAIGQCAAQVLILVLLYSLIQIVQGSLYNMVSIYGSSLIASNILISVLFFKNHKDLVPVFKFNKKLAHPLMSIGLKFFIIQLAVLVIFTTDKILILQLFEAKLVTAYEVVFKLFTLILLGHSLFCAPLWSAYTDAYHRNDIHWIKTTMRRQILIYFPVAIAILLLAGFADTIIIIWVGDNIIIPDGLVLMVAAFTMLATWNNIYATMINGTGLIQVQMYTALFGLIINIPLSIYFATYMGMGVSGIVAGSFFSLLPGGVLLPIQVYTILKNGNNA